MDKALKLKVLTIVGGLLLASLVYAVWSIIAYEQAEEREREYRAREAITYLKKADVEELLAKPLSEAEYTWEVYVGEGGYSQWHTQKLFLLRHKPFYKMLNDHYVRFKVFMGDTTTSERKNDASYAKDLIEVKKAKAIAPLEYRMYNKDKKLVMHIRGQIPNKDGLTILRMALAQDAAEKCQFMDYVKIREAQLAKMREAAEKRIRERVQGMGKEDPKQRQMRRNTNKAPNIKRPIARPVPQQQSTLTRQQQPAPARKQSTLISNPQQQSSGALQNTPRPQPQRPAQQRKSTLF